MKEIPTNWFMEFITPDNIQQFSVKNILYSGKSKYQSVQVLDTPPFGKCLVLDGKIQSCEADEFIYHESQVHPALIAHPEPATVFIGGGGEGATLREVLRHKIVQKTVMIDIDKKVVDLCKKHLPTYHQGAFEDKRVELLHTDALKYLKESTQSFDVIILDFSEPLEGSPAYLLFTAEFYQCLKKHLADGGILALQAGAASMGLSSTFLAVVNTLKTVYPVVLPYHAEVRSFNCSWGFALASQGPISLSPAEIDRRIGERINGKLRFYDGITHQGMFALPKYLRDQIAGEKRVISRDNPMFTFSYVK